MSMTFDKVRALVQRGEVRLSDHGYDEMSDENILAGMSWLVFSTVLWSKTILCMPRDHVSSGCKRISTSS